uniref:Uncharacterized protein n=1 Tax=Globodera rostochiensis TaxID=31243 RepID=A0A914HT86_GLORO
MLAVPLPLYLDRRQAPPKARRHYLPLSLSEWDVRIRNGEGGHCWNRGRRRSRSWISTDRSRTAGPILLWETLPLGGKRQRAQNQTSPYPGRPSFYQRIYESMTMLRSSSRHPPAGSSSPAAAKEEDGQRAEDATSLDTWLTRQRHRRRNTLNLSLAGGGNGNSRFGRLVSSLSKLREAFSLSSTRANGGGTTTKVTEEVQQQQQQKVQGTEWAPEAQSTALPPLGEHCQWLRCRRLFVDNDDGEGTDAIAGGWGNTDSNSNRTKSAQEVVSDGWMSIMTLDH